MKLSKFIVLAVVIALIVPGVSVAAISKYGGLTPAGDTGAGWHTGTSFIYAFNVGATSTNPGMFIECSSRVADTITGAKWGSTAATKIGNSTDASANTDYFSLWFVPNPSTGEQNVECDSSSNVIVSSMVYVYNGTAATQTAITTNAVNNNFTSTQDLTSRATSTVAGSWIVGIGAVTSLDGLATVGDDSGVTSNLSKTTFSGQVGLLDSSSTVAAGTGYNIHTKTVSGNSQWKIATVYTALEPAASAAAPCRIKVKGACH